MEDRQSVERVHGQAGIQLCGCKSLSESARKVQSNLIKETHCFTKENVETAELNEVQRLEIVKGLAKLRDVWKAEGWNLTLATCAEEANLEKYDIDHNRCIDGELMERVFGEDKELVYYLHTNRIYSERFLLFLLNGKI